MSVLREIVEKIEEFNGDYGVYPTSGTLSLNRYMALIEEAYGRKSLATTVTMCNVTNVTNPIVGDYEVHFFCPSGCEARPIKTRYNLAEPLQQTVLIKSGRAAHSSISSVTK